MLLRDALRRGVKTLIEGGIPAPELAAELLLMHVLGCDRGELHAHPDRKIPIESTSRYFDLIAQRLTGKPTQYITGHQEFWGLDFGVTPNVLIPRPETELLVEAALEFAANYTMNESAPLRLVDVGTGSSCIALALASELPDAEIYAVDISPAALAVARRNAARLNLAGQVRFSESDLLGALLNEGLGGTFDAVVSNPPYVGLHELEKVQREVRDFEPRLAWGGLEREDEIYRRLFPEALELLKRGGWVAVEIGYDMRDAIVSLLEKQWTQITVRPDLAGIPRVVAARKP